jgi:hypothetical protein
MRLIDVFHVSLCFVVGALTVSCKDEPMCASDSEHYQYNMTTGRCQNCAGEEGYNVFDLDFIQKTKDAECVDLSKKFLVTLIEGKMATDLAYDTLYEYNFRGARFDSAALFFNHIMKSDFRGADLRLLQYGYAIVDGATDTFTKLPVEGSCKASADSIVCFR